MPCYLFAQETQNQKGEEVNCKQWDDVADLLNEAATMFETAYGEHDLEARKYCAKRVYAMAVRAQGKANRLYGKERKAKK